MEKKGGTILGSMATKQEEKNEQAFFSGKVKEQEKEDMKHEKTVEEPDKYKDSLGQENPAHELQLKTIKEVGEINKKAAEDAEKGPEHKEA